MKNKLILIFSLIIAISISGCKKADPITITIEMKAMKNDMYQLFYISKGQKYSENQSIRVNVQAADNFQYIEYVLPEDLESVEYLRFDLGISDAEIFINSISIKKADDEVILNADNILKRIKQKSKNIVEIKKVNSILTVKTTSKDPYFTFSMAGLLK